MGKEEGGVSKTLILSALKISRRITKQKGKIYIFIVGVRYACLETP